MYQGSCLCGAIEIHIDGAIDSIIHCHCSRCRKSSGTAYATNGFIARAALHIVTGADKLAAFESSPGRTKHFCSVCASPVYSANDQDPERLRLRLGMLDSDISERPGSHNFMDSKANWDDPHANLPHYPGYEPARQRG